MSEVDLRSKQRSMTPLWIISLFLSLTEIVAGVAVSQAEGGIQVAFTAFAISFPILVAAAFFLVLWYRPYVLYPPTEYDSTTDVERFVGAMRPPAVLGSTRTNVEQAVTASVGQAVTAAVEQTVTASASSTVVTVEAVLEQKTPAANWFDLWQAGQYDEAVSQLKVAFDTSPIATPLVRECLIGRILLDKDQATGVKHFEQLFRSYPGEPEPYDWLATTLMLWEQYDTAFDVTNRGISASNKRGTLYIVKAKLLDRAGDTNAALAVLQQAAREEPGNAAIYTAAASICASRGNHDTVVTWYLDGLKTNANDASLLAGLAAEYVTQGRSVDALAIYRRLVRVEPRDPTYLALLGNVYLALGLISKAMDAYERAELLSEGKQAWITGNIGNMLRNQGLCHKAVDYLTRAAALDPTSSYIHDRLAGALKGIEAEDLKEAELLNSTVLPSGAAVSSGA